MAEGLSTGTPAESSTGSSAHHDPPTLVVPKGRSSKAWVHFGSEDSEHGEVVNKREARCQICWKSVAYSGNTTNLMQHLCTWHPDKTGDKPFPGSTRAVQFTSEPTTSSLMPVKKLSPGSEIAKAITRKDCQVRGTRHSPDCCG